MPTIIRVVHKERPYLMIDKQTIRDLSSDLPALGLLVVLLSKSDLWRVRPEQLATEIGTTSRSVYRVLARLIGAGYVSRVDETRRVEGGRFERRTCYTIYEDRRMAPAPTDAVFPRVPDTRIGGLEVPF